MSTEYLPPVLDDFKYYKGEAENESPFPPGDICSRYWWGERMFASINDKEHLFTDYMNEVKEWKKRLKENNPNESAHLLKTNNARQLCVAYYIVLLFGKWCHNDREDFIFDY